MNGRTLLAIAAVVMASAAQADPLNVFTASLRPKSPSAPSTYVLRLLGGIGTNATDGVFEPEWDEIELRVGASRAALVEAGAKGLRVKSRPSGVRIEYRRPKKAVTPLRRLSANLANGDVRVIADGLAPPALGAVTATLRFGGASFSGLVVAGATDPGTGTTIPFTPLDSSHESFVETASTSVAVGADAWASIWSAYSLDIVPLPPVDFTKNVVVTAFLGFRPTRGYAVRIASVVQRGDILTVGYVETRPGDACTNTNKPVAPAAFAVVPRGTWRGIVFEHLVETDDGCLLQH